MGRRHRIDTSGMKAEAGVFLAGNRSLRIERDGRPEILAPGDPFPEAESLPPRRLRLLVERGDVVFVRTGGVSAGTIRNLVLGLTKGAFGELVEALGLELSEGLSKEEAAAKVAQAIVEAEGLEEADKVRALFEIARQPKERPTPARLDVSSPAEPLVPDDWDELAPGDLARMLLAIPEALVEELVKGAHLNAQVVLRIQETARLAKRKELPRIETYAEAAVVALLVHLHGHSPDEARALLERTQATNTAPESPPAAE